jgi:2-hydroxychromene-2-carboxylate isomerase
VSKLVDYYFSPISPWTYLGHPRLAAMLKKYDAKINVKPVDLGGKIFPISGGLPLPQRAPQRQAYRLAELARWRDFLKMPLTIKPKFFPAPGDLSACMIIAAKAHGEDAALRLSWGILKACWQEERNTGDVETLQAIAKEQGLDGADLLAQAQGEAVKAQYAAFTQEAIERQVFGAPSYVIDGEIFWGQDRLEFVDRKLASS